MATAAYLCGGFTMLVCAILLLRGYTRVRQNLLLWSGVCFLGLSIANFLIFIDLVLVPQLDLYPLRLSTTAASMLLLVFGLIWESE
jgi:hypothetical protein